MNSLLFRALGSGSMMMLLALAAPAVQAQKIQSVRLVAPQVELGSDVQLLVDLKEEGARVWCGLVVDFGNGSKREIRIGDNEATDLKQVIRYSYPNPGRYVISIKGGLVVRGLKSALACGGAEALQEVTIVDGEAARALAAKERELAERERILAERERAASAAAGRR